MAEQIGPRGERRPADPIANAVHVAKLATGEIKELRTVEREKPVPPAKSQGLIGG